MRHRLWNVIETISNARSPSEAVERFRAAVERLGYNRISYRALRDDSPIIFDNSPTGWLESYLAKRIQDDPATAMFRATSHPFLYADLYSRPHPPEVMATRRAAQSIGLHHAVGFPLHGPNGRVRGLTLSTAEKDFAHDLSMITAIVHQFDMTYTALTSPPLQPTPRLTAREHEVLRWVAAGKSNWDIGEIIGVTAHAVDFHLRNAFRKLGVSDRVSAVLKAVAFGLLNLALAGLADLPSVSS